MFCYNGAPKFPSENKSSLKQIYKKGSLGSTLNFLRNKHLERNKENSPNQQDPRQMDSAPFLKDGSMREKQAIVRPRILKEKNDNFDVTNAAVNFKVANLMEVMMCTQDKNRDSGRTTSRSFANKDMEDAAYSPNKNFVGPCVSSRKVNLYHTQYNRPQNEVETFIINLIRVLKEEKHLHLEFRIGERKFKWSEEESRIELQRRWNVIPHLGVSFRIKNNSKEDIRFVLHQLLELWARTKSSWKVYHERWRRWTPVEGNEMHIIHDSASQGACNILFAANPLRNHRVDFKTIPFKTEVVTLE